ncbi:MAG: hypothetical protein QM741_04930 [Rudaea sp.]|uniref:hypothetical protein n=1 Tax=Rudaea sp. TaxID=2136325 RepID=UPI0039E524DA
MSTEGSGPEESCPTSQRLCLRALAEADPGALIRVLQLFQQLNVVPSRVTAEAMADRPQIEIHVAHFSEARLSLITAKAGQVPSILSARWVRA